MDGTNAGECQHTVTNAFTCPPTEAAEPGLGQLCGVRHVVRHPSPPTKNAPSRHLAGAATWWTTWAFGPTTLVVVVVDGGTVVEVFAATCRRRVELRSGGKLSPER